MASGCSACGLRLWFIERGAWPSEYCFGCAQARGITRLSDHYRLAAIATTAAPLVLYARCWVYVWHAISWSVLHKRYQAISSTVIV